MAWAGGARVPPWCHNRARNLGMVSGPAPSVVRSVCEAGVSHLTSVAMRLYTPAKVGLLSTLECAVCPRVRRVVYCPSCGTDTTPTEVRGVPGARLDRAPCPVSLAHVRRCHSPVAAAVPPPYLPPTPSPTYLPTPLPRPPPLSLLLLSFV